MSDQAVVSVEEDASGPVTAASRLARNSLLNLSAQVLPLVVGLIALPRVITGLGAGRYGVLTLAWTLLGYLSVFDFGLTRATTKFVAELAAQNRHDEVPRVAWTTILMQVGLGSLGGAVLAILAHPLAHRILNVPSALAGEATACFLMLALAVPIVLLSNSLRGLLEAAQRFDLVNYVRAPSNTLYYLLPLVGVVVHATLPVIMLGFVVSWSVAVGCQLYLCSKVYRGFGNGPQFERREARRLLRFGGWAAISGLISPVLVYADRVIIGTMLTMAAVSYYAVPFDMITRILVVPSSLVGTLFPAFSAISAGQGNSALSTLLSRSSKFLLIALAPVLVTIAIFADELLRVWIGSEFARHSAWPLRFLALGVLANAMAQIPFSLTQATGRPDIAARFHLIELPIHVVGIVVGVYFWGITGAAAAWSLRVTLDAVLLYIAAMRLSGTRWTTFRDERIPELVGVLALGAVGMILAAQKDLNVVLRSALAAITIAAVSWRIWSYTLTPAERVSVMRLARRVPA